MLCPIHAGPSFRQGLHTKNGLDLLLAHGPVGLVRPYLLFLSSSPTISSIKIEGLIQWHMSLHSMLGELEFAKFGRALPLPLFCLFRILIWAVSVFLCPALQALCMTLLVCLIKYNSF